MFPPMSVKLNLFLNQFYVSNELIMISAGPRELASQGLNGVIYLLINLPINY